MCRHLITLVICLFAVACGPTERRGANTSAEPRSTAVPETPAPAKTSAVSDSARQVSQYIRRMLQDREGNIWFGTTSDGVARYDGRSLTYFTPANGFANNWVGGMLQAQNGDLWFATGGGISRYDGTRFTNYTRKNGLAHDQVFAILQDRQGGFWAATEEGVSRFDGTTFRSFPLPPADLSRFPYFKYPEQVNALLEDRNGHLWFGTNGGGVYRYDGTTLKHLGEEDGLCNNFVQSILQDHQGNMWFGTRYGGAAMMDMRSPRSVTQTGSGATMFGRCWNTPTGACGSVRTGSACAATMARSSIAGPNRTCPH